MRRTARVATGAIVLGVVTFAGAPAAVAADVVACDSYGRTCTPIKGNPLTGGSTGDRAVSGRTTTPNTLPFTGGDIVLLSVLGAGTLAGGTALVVAGRRRTPATA